MNQQEQTQDDYIDIKKPIGLPVDENSEKEQRELFGDAKRNEDFKNSLHNLSIVFTWIVGGIAIIVIAIRIAHLGLSVKYEWLTNDQLQSIDKIFFSGTIGGLLTNYIKKYKS